MAGKQFTLYSHQSGPNPWKVVIILKELGLEYNTVWVDMNTGEHKREPYTKLNPNGRMPTLIDHSNGDFKIWESGAIIEYLLGKYDPSKKLGFEKFEDEMLARQWLYFQASGQGPYYGQAMVFQYFFPEKLPGAIERYQNETKRVLMVLNTYLTDNKVDFLVNNRLSYADLSFFMWNTLLGAALPGQDWKAEYPAVAKWDAAVAARPSVVATLAEQKAAKEAQAAAAAK
jgi:glutathione S-transferase